MIEPEVAAPLLLEDVSEHGAVEDLPAVAELVEMKRNHDTRASVQSITKLEIVLKYVTELFY
jgi:hypothetical protein